VIVPERRGILALGALAIAACASVPHALDDLKCVHSSTPRSLDHKYEVERYGWLGAMAKWGVLRFLPGAESNVRRGPETLEDPSAFCVEAVAELLEVDLQDLVETGAVLYWAGAIVDGDPFPLSRIRGLQVVGRIANHLRPDLGLLAGREVDYIAVTERRLSRLERLVLLSKEGALTEELKREYLQTVQDLGRTPYPLANESRGIGHTLALATARESDPDLTHALATGALVNLTRGSLQTLDRGLADSEELVRAAAAREMVRSLGAGTLAHVISRLKEDPSAFVRREVAALAGSAPAAVAESEPIVEHLIVASRDPDSSVSVNAMESLGALTGIGRHLDTDFWRAWWERRVLESPSSRR
jgi:hypothetical protein